MARTSIEDEAWVRMENMAKVLNVHKIIVYGAIANLWHRSQDSEVSEIPARHLGLYLELPPEIDADSFTSQAVEFGFLSRKGRAKYYVVGNEKHIENKKQYRTNGAIGGKSRAKNLHPNNDGKSPSTSQQPENTDVDVNQTLQATLDPNSIQFNSSQFNSKEKISGTDVPSISPPVFSPKNLAELWNEKVGTRLSKVELTKFSDSPYYEPARLRLKFKPEREYWVAVIDRILASNFCLGEKGWRADFEFLVRPKSHIKVMNGTYDNRGTVYQAPTAKSPEQTERERLKSIVAKEKHCDWCLNTGVYLDIKDQKWACGDCRCAMLLGVDLPVHPLTVGEGKASV